MTERSQILVDMHSHILPAIDDGSPDVGTSLKMLSAEKTAGVEKIVLTPHFSLSRQSVSCFIESRERAYERIFPEADRLGLKLYKGAEVLYTHSIADIELDRLCIGNTGYLLIELPYERLTGRFINGFRSFEGSIFPEIRLILAHAERYLSFTSEQSLLEVISPDMLVQVNCGSFAHFGKHRSFIYKMMQNNCVHLLGTDCHNTAERPPNVDIAKKAITKKFSEQFFFGLMRNAERVLDGEMI